MLTELCLGYKRHNIINEVCPEMAYFIVEAYGTNLLVYNGCIQTKKEDYSLNSSS
jgi:hypothetical protein